MGRERQKKKNRSSVSKVRPKSGGRTKIGRKKVNFLGNETIAKNWDRKLTLSQNYKQLGLSSRLNAPTGGTEKKLDKHKDNEGPEKLDSFAIPATGKIARLAPQEVQVERDPETGHIIRVIRLEQDSSRWNPLGDPLNDIMDTDDEQQQLTRGRSNGIVAELEARVAQEEELLIKKHRPRQQSQREEAWIAALVDKYGDDIPAMVKDRKLNPMQQTAGDIGRRIKKWRLHHPPSG